jgi:hypothetical protein
MKRGHVLLFHVVDHVLLVLLPWLRPRGPLICYPCLCFPTSLSVCSTIVSLYSDSAKSLRALLCRLALIVMKSQMLRKEVLKKISVNRIWVGKRL